MIEIVKIGGYATIQGCERKGVQKYGIPKGGYMDIGSAVLANKMMGNDPCTALIELFGGHLTFDCHADMLLSLAGSSVTAVIRDHSVHSPAIFSVKKGDRISIGALSEGNILYIAVKNGFDVDEPFGSSSTYVPAALGPNKGSHLMVGDRVKTFRTENSESGIPDSTTHFPKNQSISVYQGPEFDLLTDHGKRILFEESFEIAQVNRMGYRLAGSKITTRSIAKLTSRYVSRGTVQLPSGGNPIVLMSDSQTTGGYPRIAQVVAEDIDAFAQMKTRSRVRFRLQTTY